MSDCRHTHAKYCLFKLRFSAEDSVNPPDTAVPSPFVDDTRESNDETPTENSPFADETENEITENNSPFTTENITEHEKEDTPPTHYEENSEDTPQTTSFDSVASNIEDAPNMGDNPGDDPSTHVDPEILPEIEGDFFAGKDNPDNLESSRDNPLQRRDESAENSAAENAENDSLLNTSNNSANNFNTETLSTENIEQVIQGHQGLGHVDQGEEEGAQTEENSGVET